MPTDKERAAAAAAANSPEQAERPGQAARGEPPKPGEVFNPGDFTPAERDRSNEYAGGREKPTTGPGLPDDLAVTGGWEHGAHTFVPQSLIDRETGSPVQRTVCAECGAELVDA